MSRLFLAPCILPLLALTACSRESDDRAAQLTGGSPSHGRVVMVSYGCNTCHTIPGIKGADATVGPPLQQMGNRTYVAGVLTNTPTHLVDWIKNPPAIDEKTAMPNLRVSDADARDMAAYLYTLR
jgi:cytochrome c